MFAVLCFDLIMSLTTEHKSAGVKKSLKIHLSPGQVHQKFYLSCY